MNDSKTTKRRDLWVRLLLYPGHTLPTAAAPVAVAAGLALRDGVLAPIPVFIAFLASWLIHIAGVFYDNHELLRRYPALPEHPELLDAVERGTLKPGVLRLAIIVCLALALLCAPYLYRIGGPPVLLLGAIGVVSSLSYAGGPLAYARHGLAEPVFLFMFGAVAVYGAYFIQLAAHIEVETGWLLLPRLPLESLYLGLPAGALVTAVLIIDDIRDRDFDRTKGWRTGTVRFGLGWSRIRFVALVAFAYVAPLPFWLLADMSPWVLLPLITLPLAVLITRTVLQYDTTHDLLPMTPATSKLSLIYALLLAAGIALSG